MERARGADANWRQLVVKVLEAMDCAMGPRVAAALGAAAISDHLKHTIVPLLQQARLWDEALFDGGRPAGRRGARQQQQQQQQEQEQQQQGRK